MIVDVNGEQTQLPEGATVRGMLEELDLGRKGGISVAVNGRIVRAGQWDSHELLPEDRVVILTVAQGG